MSASRPEEAMVIIVPWTWNMPDDIQDRRCFFKTTTIIGLCIVLLSTEAGKKVRFVCEGIAYIVEDGGIVFLSCLMNPIFPPV